MLRGRASSLSSRGAPLATRGGASAATSSAAAAAASAASARKRTVVDDGDSQVDNDDDDDIGDDVNNYARIGDDSDQAAAAAPPKAAPPAAAPSDLSTLPLQVNNLTALIAKLSSRLDALESNGVLAPRAASAPDTASTVASVLDEQFARKEARRERAKAIEIFSNLVGANKLSAASLGDYLTTHNGIAESLVDKFIALYEDVDDFGQPNHFSPDAIALLAQAARCVGNLRQHIVTRARSNHSSGSGSGSSSGSSNRGRGAGSGRGRGASGRGGSSSSGKEDGE